MLCARRLGSTALGLSSSSSSSSAFVRFFAALISTTATPSFPIFQQLLQHCQSQHMLFFSLRQLASASQSTVTRTRATKSVSPMVLLSAPHPPAPYLKGRGTPPAPAPAPAPAADPPSSSSSSRLPAALQPVYELRDYQRECINTCLSLFRHGEMRQAVSLPVGSGKTVVFAHLIKELPDPNPTATRTLVLAHRTELLQQARAKISQVNPHLRVSIMAAASGEEYDSSADVVVASVATLGRTGSARLALLQPEQFKCIVIDEAHHVVSRTYMRILEHFGVLDKSRKTHIALWGCSATMQRHDGRALGAVFDTIAYARNVTDMWAAGHLCRPRSVLVRTNIDISQVGSSLGDFALNQLTTAINTPMRNGVVLATWREWARTTDTPRRSTLIFAADVSHAQGIAQTFAAVGVDARVVFGKTSADDRATIVEEFRRGLFPVLVNCEVFTEGTDIPTIDCVVLARPTRSGVLYQQMMGRGLRLSPGKQDCLVIDFVDNVGRNAIMTVPSLLGLQYDFDAKGEDIVYAKDKMAELARQARAAAHAKSLEEAQAAAKPVITYDVGEKEVMGADKKFFRSLTDMPFVEYKDSYFLHLPSRSLLAIAKDHNGYFRAILFHKMAVEHVPMRAQQLRPAFAAAMTHIKDTRPSDHLTLTRTKGAAFSMKPISPAQAKLLAAIMPNVDTSRFTSGAASRKINDIFTLQAARRHHKRLASELRGLQAETGTPVTVGRGLADEDTQERDGDMYDPITGEVVYNVNNDEDAPGFR